MSLPNRVQSLVFAAKHKNQGLVSCSEFLRKIAAYVNFIGFWWQPGLLQVCDCNGNCVWRILQAWILCRKVPGSVTGKPRLAVASNQTKLSATAILNVSTSIEKCSLTSDLMKMATNCFILSNQKLWYGTQFLHKNKVK